MTCESMTCGFVPPYLLRHVAETARQAGAAAAGHSTLAIDERIRTRRERASAAVSAAPAGAGGRVIHSADHAEQLPGRVVRAEGAPPSGDSTVDEAYDSAGDVLDLFAGEFGRRSYDGADTTVTVTVHYGTDYDNAFWDGSQLVFGDGDGVVFGSFTKPIDVMGHEFTHAVTQFTAGLTYSDQSGALNESVSDVFGSMTKQRVLGQTVDQADWLIGEGIFVAGINGRALRSISEPGTAYDDPRLGKDPQVASMADYVHTTDDNGGVHINSGIPNRAFALAANALGGHSWERAGKVWYDALTGGAVTAGTDFAGFAAATVSSAERLFAADPEVAAKVRDAWVGVGVLDAAPAPDGPPPAAPDAAPGDQGPAGPATLTVRRTGGIAGLTVERTADLTSHPQRAELRQLVAGLPRAAVGTSRPIPDAFVYTFEFGGRRLVVGQYDLSGDQRRIVELVLGP